MEKADINVVERVHGKKTWGRSNQIYVVERVHPSVVKRVDT